jgi:nucleoside-diphosphate-sugar epimerase
MNRFCLIVCALQLIVSLTLAFSINSNPVKLKSTAIKAINDYVPADKRSIFIFGLGYVGTALATSLLKDGWKVCGTCTNVIKIRSLRSLGIEAYLFDEDSGRMVQPEAVANLADCSYVLSTVPPAEGGSTVTDIVLREHATDLKRSALAGKLSWVGYISSTGVYGDRNGAWVNEDAELRPENQKTKLRAAAEAEWRELHQRRFVHIIYKMLGNTQLLSIYMLWTS